LDNSSNDAAIRRNHPRKQWQGTPELIKIVDFNAIDAQDNI
jgi:hypothetical protein